MSHYHPHSYVPSVKCHIYTVLCQWQTCVLIFKCHISSVFTCVNSMCAGQSKTVYEKTLHLEDLLELQHLRDPVRLECVHYSILSVVIVCTQNVIQDG